MHLVITGGAGFLGVRLARTLLQRGTLALAGAAPQPITRLTLVDRAAPPVDLTADARVQVVTGDLNELLTPDAHGTTRAVPADAQAVVHLAAAVSGECEADFDLGLRSNLDATRALLQACRALDRRGFGMTPERAALVRQWHPDGLPEADIHALQQRLQAHEQAAAARPVLRVVGGA